MDRTNKSVAARPIVTRATRPLILASFAQSSWPIVSCLREAERILGPDRVWHAINEIQAWFLNNYFDSDRAVELDVIEAIASFDADEVMAWLAKRRFSHHINPFGENEFGTASVLDVLLKWPEKSAMRSKLTVYDDATGTFDTYDAVKMNRFVNFSTVAEHPHPIVELLTQEQRTGVFMTIVDQPPVGEFGLIALARRFTSRSTAADLDYSGVVFPMVSFEEKHRLDWLLRLRTTNANLHNWPAEIFEACQINRVRMDDVGVRLESAATGFVRMLGGGPEYYEVNAPFLLWAVRDGHENPLMAAFVDRDGWKDSGGLGEKGGKR